MVFFSTRQSLLQQEISLLAIVETILAVSATYLVYYFFDFSAHFFGAMLLAPFLLLQNEASETRVAVWVVSFNSWWSPKFNRLEARSYKLARNVTAKRGDFIGGIFTGMLMYYVMLLRIIDWLGVLLAVKFLNSISIILDLSIHPLATLSNFPRNWRKIVLCIDSASIPVLVPGLEKLKQKNPQVEWITEQELISGLFQTLREIKFSIKLLFFFMISFLPVLIILGVPAMLYRWSLKSTALVWSPLLWAFRPIQKSDDLSQFAKRVLNLSFYRIARFYSLLVLVLYLVKVLLWFKWVELMSNSQYGQLTLNRFVAPNSLITWHLGAVVNSILTWWIFFQSESYLHDLKTGNSVSPDEMRTFYLSTFYTRNIISLYVSFCVIYITVSLIVSIELPPQRIVLVPWN